jgi:hypothetical protein
MKKKHLIVLNVIIFKYFTLPDDGFLKNWHIVQYNMQ